MSGRLAAGRPGTGPAVPDVDLAGLKSGFRSALLVQPPDRTRGDPPRAAAALTRSRRERMNRVSTTSSTISPHRPATT